MQTAQEGGEGEEGVDEGEESFTAGGEEEEEIAGLLERNEAELEEAGLLESIHM